MSAQDIQLAVENNRIIPATLFEPARSNGISVQINSALATPRQYYRHFAQHLAERGFTLLTYDYQGLIRPGQDIRREQSLITDWGRCDQTAAAQYLLQRYPQHKLALLAHSIGGQIIGLSPLAGVFRAILMIGTAHGYWRQFPARSQRLRQWLVWNLVAPCLITVCGYLPGRYIGMFDMPANAAWQMRRFCSNPHWLCDERGRAHRPYNAEVRVALRHVLFTDDEVVPPGTQIRLDDFYPDANYREEMTQPGDMGMERVGHFGYFRRSMARAAWDNAMEWFIANV